jgi:hypothetical protein
MIASAGISDSTPRARATSRSKPRPTTLFFMFSTPFFAAPVQETRPAS